MKNIKKLYFLLALISLISFTLSFTAFAHDDVKPIEDNDKIFTDIPWEYELSVFSDNLSYYDEDGNYLEFCVYFLIRRKKSTKRCNEWCFF